MLHGPVGAQPHSPLAPSPLGMCLLQHQSAARTARIASLPLPSPLSLPTPIFAPGGGCAAAEHTLPTDFFGEARQAYYQAKAARAAGLLSCEVAEAAAAAAAATAAAAAANAQQGMAQLQTLRLAEQVAMEKLLSESDTQTTRAVQQSAHAVQQYAQKWREAFTATQQQQQTHMLELHQSHLDEVMKSACQQVRWASGGPRTLARTHSCTAHTYSRFPPACAGEQKAAQPRGRSWRWRYSS